MIESWADGLSAWSCGFRSVEGDYGAGCRGRLIQCAADSGREGSALPVRAVRGLA
jgi:hypothetical protein